MTKRCQSEFYIIASFDAEKAYDSIDHDYLKIALSCHGYPAKFIQCVSLLYKDLKAVVQVHGHLSRQISINRGVKQGDALSCSLFILAINPLLRDINNNRNITGVPIGDRVVKAMAYADDVAIVTKAECLQSVFSAYENLFSNSGLKLNADKTEILCLSADSQAEVNGRYLGVDLCLEPVEAVTICGCCLSLSKDMIYESNVTRRIDNLSRILSKWKYRNMTIIGKMVVIKTYAMSQLVYVSQFMNISAADIRRIEKICYGFLWNDKPEQTQRAFLKNDKYSGGINGVDVEAFLDAIKVKQFVKSYKLSPLMCEINKRCNNESGIVCRAKYAMHKLLKSSDCILTDADYVKLSHSNIVTLIGANEGVRKLILLYNITSISDIAGSLMSRKNKNTIYKQLSLCLKPCIIADRLGESQVGSYLSIAQGTIVDLYKANSSSIQRWLKVAYKKVKNISIGHNYKTVEDRCIERQTFKSIWLIKYPKLIALRLKLIYRSLYPNSRRFAAKLCEHPNCSICGEIETYDHMLFDCDNAKRLWNMYSEVAALDMPDNLYDAINYCEYFKAELAKTFIFKALIGIDRGVNMTRNMLCALIQSYERVDDCLTSD